MPYATPAALAPASRSGQACRPSCAPRWHGWQVGQATRSLLNNSQEPSEASLRRSVPRRQPASASFPKNRAVALALCQFHSITSRMKQMDFFVWQGGWEVNSQAIDDDPNAARRKKTRFHGTSWVEIGITCQRRCPSLPQTPAPPRPAGPAPHRPAALPPT